LSLSTHKIRNIFLLVSGLGLGVENGINE
jgi:hypothetical protein